MGTTCLGNLQAQAGRWYFVALWYLLPVLMAPTAQTTILQLICWGCCVAALQQCNACKTRG